jgi:RNA polymerase sigma factor (sigma-70 family)
MGDRSDAELLHAVRERQQEAWEALVGRHNRRLWALARAEGLSSTSASDAVQTTWLALLDNIDRIRKPDALAIWLTQVVKHEAMRLSKQLKRVESLDDGMADVADRSAPAVDQGLLRGERLQDLRRAFARLSATCQKLLRLLFSDADLSYAEIAAALGRPIGAIGPSRARCLAELRRELAPSG